MQQQRAETLLAQGVLQYGRLRRLAGAVPALEGYEKTRHGRQPILYGSAGPMAQTGTPILAVIYRRFTAGR